jgi:hypothetical protein
MTKRGKQFIGTLFVLAAVGCVIASFVATNNYNDGWTVYGTHPPERPKPLWYVGASGAFLVGSFVMINMASNDKTSRGFMDSQDPAA